MAATPRPQTEPWETGGRWGLYRAKFDVDAPWDCPRLPQQRYGATSAGTLNTSVRMDCSTDWVRPRAGGRHPALVNVRRRGARDLLALPGSALSSSGPPSGSRPARITSLIFRPASDLLLPAGPFLVPVVVACAVAAVVACAVHRAVSSPVPLPVSRPGHQP
jgi:hypothetical protein